ncbi:MAG: flavodoxin-dependent (E)-4-hydroxy-3-methylbut-2-enyl-diphosphate synthase, partial [Myxococcota bacterium]
NYADKKKFEIREYDENQYQAEVTRVADRFRPLVLRCKQNGTAMRIGTNHGSLSDRIMNRFGDTARGMVESAIEFLEVCEAENYYDVVFSMKASNTQVAISAYRLLAARLEERRPGEPSYPFHVGVTEAGGAEDGRIKSAIGIGSLLEDGLGDTIRVSLTEDPVREVPVARGIVARAGWVAPSDPTSSASPISATSPLSIEATPFVLALDQRRRPTRSLDWAGLDVGGDAPIRVELEVVDALRHPAETAARIATELSLLREVACESLLIPCRGTEELGRVGLLQRELESLGQNLPISLRIGLGDEEIIQSDSELPAVRVGRWVGRLESATSAKTLRRFSETARRAGAAIEWEIEARDHEIPEIVRRGLANLAGDEVDCAISLVAASTPHENRVLVAALADAGAANVPIVLRHQLDSELNSSAKDVQSGGNGTGIEDAPAVGIGDAVLIDASVRLGSLLCDGIGDLLSIRSDTAAAVDLTYRILQGARRRTTRTEYISCPSCGRTLFDLEETTAKIQAKTAHLSGLKIAVMGCIVNGPGEMADADFGYVGSGVGEVTLYVGKEVVARAVPEAEATDRLIDLIRENDQWQDEPSAP